MAAAKRPSPELTNKVNVNPVGNRLQEATAEDYIETAEILNDHASKLDALTGTTSGRPILGVFSSLVLLQAAYPTGTASAYAIIDAGVGATPQIALWDSTDGIWVINSVAENVKFVANVAALPAPGIENMIYVTLDTFKAYVWKNSQYNLIFTFKNTSDLINDGELFMGGDKFVLNSAFQELVNQTAGNTSNENELIEKGFHHIINFDWYVFAQKYRWNGVLYELPEDLVIDTVTIDPAPTTVDFKRFDVIVFNDDFTFSKVKGDEGLNPAIPKIDIRTQLQLTVVLVEYGTTSPSYLTKQLMYDEGLGLPAEFAVTKTGASITLNSTQQASSGTKCIKVANPINSDVLFLDKGEVFSSLDVDTISFKVKNATAGSWKFFIYSYNSIGAFYQGTVMIKGGRYGYDSQNITDWQTIIVPMYDLFGGAEVLNTGFAITFFNNTGLTLYFDEFFLNGNFTQAPTTSGITEAPIDSNYYVRRNAGWFSIGTLMTAWNNASTWITTNGANVLAHIANKQNSLATDGTGGKYPTVDAVNAGLATKLDASAYNQHFKGVYLTFAALVAAHPSASVGDYAQVNVVGASDVLNYNWDDEENVWIPNAVGGSGATNTDELPEGSTNLYHTGARVLATILSGLSIITGGDVVATDTVIEAFGKLQKNINTLWIAVNLNTAKISFPEAPIDTKQYARKDGAWNEVVSGSSTLSIVTVATTTYTFLLTDAAKKVIFTSATAVTATIPTNAVTAIPIGSRIEVTQSGNGVVTLVTTGLTVISASPLFLVKGQTVVLIKTAINTWSIEGNNFSGELRFPTYPSTRDDGVNPTNKVLSTDASGNVKLYKQGVFPAPYIDIVVPDSTLPSTRGNFELYGSFFTPTMTAAFTGQTVHYFIFHTTNWITVNVTTGASEGLFSIVLDNGLSKTFTNAYMVVNGVVNTPLTADWINKIGQSTAKDGGLILDIYQVSGTQDWNKSINININFRIDFNFSLSPLGDNAGTYRDNSRLYIMDSVTNLVLWQIEKERLGRIEVKYATDASGTPIYNHIEFTPFETITMKYINKIWLLYKGASLIRTFTENTNLVNPLYIRGRVICSDISNIKYTELP